MIPTTTLLLLLTLIITASLSRLSARNVVSAGAFSPELNKHSSNNNGVGVGHFFWVGGGFEIPGFGGGYGSWYGGPSGGSSKGGIVRASKVCKEKGCCFNKKLTCPAKCYTSYSRSGKGYAGGGGGCTIDCKKCTAYC